jgi:biotin carboxylase
VTSRIREDIAKILKRCLTYIGYQNAGTVEFLMDEDGNLHFIEMNAAIRMRRMNCCWSGLRFCARSFRLRIAA